MSNSIEDWCEEVFKESQVTWILLKQRGGKLKTACADCEKLLKDKKADPKQLKDAGAALKAAIDSAKTGIDTAKESVEKGDGILDILRKKHGKEDVDKKCKKAIDELKTAKDYLRDIKPILDKSEKVLKQMP